MDEERERLDVFPVGVLVKRCEGKDELEKPRGGCQKFAWAVC